VDFVDFIRVPGRAEDVDKWGEIAKKALIVGP
jgi:hypothetical protein